jgi:hypothetical protein
LKPLNMNRTVVSVKDFGNNKNVATLHGIKNGEN